jgi:hypothetical protein
VTGLHSFYVAFTDGFVTLASPEDETPTDVPAPVFVVTTADTANSELLKIWGTWIGELTGQ